MTFFSTWAKENKTPEEIETELSISYSMASKLRAGTAGVSLRTALDIYVTYGVVSHPFAKDSLDYEVEHNFYKHKRKGRQDD